MLARKLRRHGLRYGRCHAQKSGEHYTVTALVDDSALEDKGGRSDLPVEMARRLTCDGQVKEVTENGEGHLLAKGRKRRTVTKAMKAALDYFARGVPNRDGLRRQVVLP